jgi:hypothetical protein
MHLALGVRIKHLATQILLAISLTSVVTISFADPVQYEGNGHYYDLLCVDPPLTWDNALAAAASQTYMSLPGYLATVTSEGEQAFLLANFGTIGSQDIWLGGNDRSSEGTWAWHNGEAWSYSAWCPGEPNDGGDDGQDCLTYQTKGGDDRGCWDDLNCSKEDEALCYIVEFGAVETRAVPVNPWWSLTMLAALIVFLSLIFVGRHYRRASV